MRTLLRIYILLIICFCSLISCESDYDLTKGINGDITVGGSELAIPIGTTEKIVIDNLLNITNISSLITAKNGDYFITMKDKVKPTKFSIPNVVINGASPTIKPIAFNLGTKKLTRSNTNTMSFSFSIPEPFSFTSISSIPKEVVAIKSATFQKDKNENYPTITITLKFSGFPTDIPTLCLSNLTLDLPDVITYIPDSEIIGTQLIASEEITLIDGNGEYSKTVYVSGIKLTDDDKIIVDKSGNKSLQIDQSLDCQGVLTTNIIAGLRPNFSTIKGEPSITFSGATIKTVEGVVDTKAPPIDFIYSTKFPEFMVDTDTYLDLQNSSISMNAATNSPIAITAKTKITPYKNNIYIDNTEINLTLDIKQAKPDSNHMLTNFWISNSNVAAPESYTWIDKNISPIVAHTPERINVHIEPQTKQELFNIELGRDYQVDIQYEFLIPLKLGNALTINYNKDFTNIQKELPEITDKISELLLYVETDNYIPLDLTLLPIPLDSNGNLLINLSVTIDGDITSAQKDDSNKIIGTKGIKSTSKIVLKETKEGALKELNTLRMNIKAKSNEQTEGIMINKNQYLTLLMKAKIPNGITININE